MYIDHDGQAANIPFDLLLISQKSNSAHIQKTANIPSERAYREVEKREENQTAAFRRVLEKKRKKTLNRRVAEKAESGRYVNESV